MAWVGWMGGVFALFSFPFFGGEIGKESINLWPCQLVNGWKKQTSQKLIVVVCSSIVLMDGWPCI